LLGKSSKEPLYQKVRETLPKQKEKKEKFDIEGGFRNGGKELSYKKRGGMLRKCRSTPRGR